MSAVMSTKQASIMKFAPVGTYVMCKYDQATCNHLHDWSVANKIPKPLADDKIHSTLIQSSITIPHFEDINQEVKGWSFKAKKFMLMPTRFKSLSGEPEGALIVLLNAPELEDLHEQLLKKGAKHNRDSYEPHIAISYFVLKSLDIEKLPLPTFSFNAQQIVAEPIDIDWMNH